VRRFDKPGIAHLSCAGDVTFDFRKNITHDHAAVAPSLNWIYIFGAIGSLMRQLHAHCV
jgi:hypothetical protein